MIKEFVNAWDQRKNILEEHIRNQDQEGLDYKKLLVWLIEIVINPLVTHRLYVDKIHVVDEHDYSGTQLFIVRQGGLDLVTDYLWTYQEYGSCSGCDLLESIRNYDDGKPDDEQVKRYMMLELHLLQRFRYMLDRDLFDEDCEREDEDYEKAGLE